MTNQQPRKILDVLVQLGLPDARTDKEFREALVNELAELELADMEKESPEEEKKITEQDIKQACDILRSRATSPLSKNRAANTILEAHLSGLIKELPHEYLNDPEQEDR